MSASHLVNRNIVARRGRTSMRLEPELWAALREICRRERRSLGETVQEIEAAGHKGGRTSAIRVHVISYYRSAATEAGHSAAGHGAAPDEAAFRRGAQPSSAAASSGLSGPV